MRSCKFLENHAHVIAQSLVICQNPKSGQFEHAHATGTTNRRGRGNAAPGWRRLAKARQQSATSERRKSQFDNGKI